MHGVRMDYRVKNKAWNYFLIPPERVQWVSGTEVILHFPTLNDAQNAEAVAKYVWDGKTVAPHIV